MKTILICALVIALVFAGTASIGQEDDEITLPFWDQISAWFEGFVWQVANICELPPVAEFWSDEQVAAFIASSACFAEAGAETTPSTPEPEWVTDPHNNTDDPVYEDIFGSGSNPFAGYGG